MDRILSLPVPQDPRRICSRSVSDGALLVKLHSRLRRNGHSVQPTVWTSNRWILDRCITRLCNCNTHWRIPLPVCICQLPLPLRGDLRLCGYPRCIVRPKRRADCEEISGYFQRLLGAVETEEHRDSLSAFRNCTCINLGIQQLLHRIPSRCSQRVKANSRARGHGNDSSRCLCLPDSRATQRQGRKKTSLHTRCGRVRSILHDHILRDECGCCHGSLDSANLSLGAIVRGLADVRLYFSAASRS